MDCVIKNYKNVYIRINKNGNAVTCSKNNATLLEQSKAKNIIDNLPKTLKRLNFKVEIVPDVIDGELNTTFDKKVIETKNYKISDQIEGWIEKFGICDDILKEAQKRKEELNKIISNYDKAINNWLHEVELENKKDACNGYLKYRDIKDIVDNRRIAKDEWIIINNVLQMDFRNLDKKIIDKAVVGLANRKFTYRIVEEDNTETIM